MVITKQKENELKRQRRQMQTLEQFNQIKHHAKKTSTEFTKEMQKRTGTAVITAFALVIALAWQDAIKSIVDTTIASLNITNVATLIKITLFYKVVIAILITIVCVLGIFLISKIIRKEVTKTSKQKQ